MLLKSTHTVKSGFHPPVGGGPGGGQGGGQGGGPGGGGEDDIYTCLLYRFFVSVGNVVSIA
jgi:hypothetical protein